jgi:hypothetical protein
MLIEFTVENYGPFKEKAILTMSANVDKEHPENSFNSVLGERVLSSAAMFGANASGKTYLIRALASLREIIIAPAIPNTSIGAYHPFRLSPDTRTAPVNMTIVFESNGNAYDYRLSFNSTKILNEALYHFPNGKRALVFSRKEDAYDFGRSVAKGQISISRMTSPNSSYLAVAAQLNNTICKEVHNWFINDLIILSSENEGALTEIFVKKMNADSKWKDRALNAIKNADFGITDIHGTVKTRKTEDIPMPTRDILTAFGVTAANETELFLVHDVDTPGVRPEDKIFPSWIESNGTMRFLSIIGPVIDTLSEGKTLVVDELGSKIHSMVIIWMIKLFSNCDQNTGNGQLIFNTHSQILLDLDIFRRDQIYLFEKDISTGISEMFTLSDFGERKDRDIMDGYLDGRYGAIPFISEGKI